MNAVPDLRLILFKELQAILHVATATVMPRLNHFEAYWTVFPCEAIHRAINQRSPCCEILLFSSPRVSVRDRASLVPSKREERRGCLRYLSTPIYNQSLCAHSNTNALFLNITRQQLLQGRVTRTIKGKDEPGTCFLGQILSLTAQQGFWNTAGYNGSIWKGDSQCKPEWDKDAKVRIFIETWFPPVFSFCLYSTSDSFLWKGSHLFQQGSRLFQAYFLVT